MFYREYTYSILYIDMKLYGLKMKLYGLNMKLYGLKMKLYGMKDGLANTEMRLGEYH